MAHRDSTLKPKTADASPFLPNVPESLRYLHRVSVSRRALLSRLLSSPKMKAAWEILESRLAAEARKYPVTSPLGPYRLLLAELEKSLRQHKREQKPKAVLLGELATLSKQVAKLRDAVIDPTRERQQHAHVHSRAVAAPPKTGGLFDLEMYEYFPPETMALSAPQWLQADQLQRSTLAYSLLRDWPTLSEVLDEWLLKLDEQIQGAKALPAKRNKKNKTDHSNLADRLFVVALVQYLERVGLNQKEAITVTSAMAKATLQQKNINPTFVKLALR